MTAEEYNEKVWSSDQIKEARANLENALEELDETSKGWGKMPLNKALKHINNTIHLIESLLSLG